MCAVDAVPQRWPGLEAGPHIADAPRRKGGRIGLLEHCGTGNLGDDATVATVFQQIKSRWPAASVVGLSLDPTDSARRHGIPCFAIRQKVFPCEREWSVGSHPTDSARDVSRLKRYLKKTGPLFWAIKMLRRAVIAGPVRVFGEIAFLVQSVIVVYGLDLVVICGGGQLLDWGGPWAFPYTLFKWTLLARCVRAKCIILNNGAGPLDASLSRWFIKRTLSMASYVSLRDRASADLIRSIGFRGTIHVATDCVWGLQLPGGRVSARSKPNKELVVGIAPMAYGDSSRHWVNDDEAYARLIANLAEFGGRMLERGHRIKLVSSDIWFDSQALADLEAAIRRAYPAATAGDVVQEPVANLSELLAELSCLDCYVTCRYHGVIFASLMNVPSLALAPHPKVTTVMRDMGLADYCMDIAAWDADAMTARFDRLVGDMDNVKARIRLHADRSRALLATQFDGLFEEGTKTHTEDERVLSIRRAT